MGRVHPAGWAAAVVVVVAAAAAAIQCIDPRYPGKPRVDGVAARAVCRRSFDDADEADNMGQISDLLSFCEG
jgi:hypothetical protein